MGLIEYCFLVLICWLCIANLVEAHYLNIIESSEKCSCFLCNSVSRLYDCSVVSSIPMFRCHTFFREEAC